MQLLHVVVEARMVGRQHLRHIGGLWLSHLHVAMVFPLARMTVLAITLDSGIHIADLVVILAVLLLGLDAATGDGDYDADGEDDNPGDRGRLLILLVLLNANGIVGEALTVSRIPIVGVAVVGSVRDGNVEVRPVGGRIITDTVRATVTGGIAASGRPARATGSRT